MTENNENPFENDEFPFEDFEEETTDTTTTGGNPGSGGRKPGNRNFWVAMGILAAVFVVVVIVLTIIAFVVVPQNRQARLEEAALINAHNTSTAQSATEFAMTQAQLAIPTDTPIPTETMEPSPTPVVVMNTDTPVPSPTEEPEIGGAVDDPGRTATVAALLTQAAGGGTPVSTEEGAVATATALPQSGFAEDVGLPGLFGIALGLIIVIFLVRRLRTSGTS
jgi:cytoskeletal protein RodZ